MKNLRNIILKGDSDTLRDNVLQNFRHTYELYELLFETLLNDNTYFERPEPLRHPIIFYFGHTATFFINKLIVAKIIDNRVNPAFESMFAIGVDEMDWDDLDEKHYSWPSINEVREYRKEVKKIVEQCILTLDIHENIGWNDPFWTIIMAIEHEKIHLETSSVLIRQLNIKHVKPHKRFTICQDDVTPPINSLKEVQGDDVFLGIDKEHHKYGWDNEFGNHKNYIATFKASKYLVSNAEFMEFVNDGGYENDSYWSEDGKKWKNFAKVKHPPFWVKDGSSFKFRTMTQIIDMPQSWPCEVNWLEANAFCKYKSEKESKNLRLLTEDEWTRLRDFCDIDHENTAANINLEHYASSMPVNYFEHNGFYDVIGNVWQWSQTPIYPFDGFEVHPTYDDFSTPTFDNRHNLVKGGSWISTGNETSKNSRYAFRQHFYQHAGFRYAESPNEIKSEFDLYKTDSLISQYCEFHYGQSYYNVENFPAKMARIASSLAKNRGRALDIGCAVGRSTFELAHDFDSVTGIDFSARFIRQAIELQKKGKLKYVLPTEGELVSYNQTSLDELGLKGLEKKVEFWQGDAHNLKSHFNNYDLVLALNLIDRLYNPRKFLEDLQTRMNSGAILLISSPYTWLEEYTQKENWLGGFKLNGESIKSSNTIKDILSEHFILIKEPFKVDFVIRETANKYQHTLSEAIIFQRK